MIYADHKITLDVHDAVSPVTVSVKKGNTGRRLLINLTEEGCPYQFSDECYAVFTAEKPDGNVVFNNCSIDGDVITYALTPQTVAAVGLMNCEIMLYGAYDRLITSASFNIIVEDTIYDEGKDIESETEVDALTKLISDAAEAIEALKQAGGGGTSFETDHTLKLENGILSVNTTDQMEKDNTLPITSAGVYATVGNIEALLKTI